MYCFPRGHWLHERNFMLPFTCFASLFLFVQAEVLRWDDTSSKKSYQIQKFDNGCLELPWPEAS